jgi:hypothetical protein
MCLTCFKCMLLIKHKMMLFHKVVSARPMGWMTAEGALHPQISTSTNIGVPQGPSRTVETLPPSQSSFSSFHFLATLDLPNFSWLKNNPIAYYSSWPTMPSKLPFDIPKFNGKPRENPSKHIMTYHIWCSSNLLMDDSVRIRLF